MGLVICQTRSCLDEHSSAAGACAMNFALSVLLQAVTYSTAIAGAHAGWMAPNHQSHVSIHLCTLFEASQNHSNHFHPSVEPAALTTEHFMSTYRLYDTMHRCGLATGHANARRVADLSSPTTVPSGNLGGIEPPESHLSVCRTTVHSPCGWCSTAATPHKRACIGKGPACTRYSSAHAYTHLVDGVVRSPHRLDGFEAVK